MVASVVQSTSGLTSGSTTASLTLGAAPTPGYTLLAIMSSDTTPAAVPNAGASRPYTQRLGYLANDNQAFIVWTRLVTSGDAATTTFTLSTASPAALVLVEIQGTYDKIGAIASNSNAAGTTRTATTVTPATADGLVVAAAGLHALAAVVSGVTVDNSFATLLNQPNTSTGSTFSALLTASRITAAATATGTTTFSWTTSATDRDGVQVAFTGITAAAAPARVRRIGKRR